MNKTEQDAFNNLADTISGYDDPGQSQNKFGSDAMSGHEAHAENRLRQAMRQAKTAHADRCDSVADMREAEIARLELLIEDLQPVFDAVPVRDEQWDFCLSAGFPPRLWLDATAFVMIGRDKRSYRFVRDTRLGRVVLGESAQVKVIAAAVIQYIAQRMVERERLLQGELLPLQMQPEAQQAEASTPTQLSVSQQAAALAIQPPASRADNVMAAVIWFMIGALLGCTVLAFVLQTFFGFRLF